MKNLFLPEQRWEQKEERGREASVISYKFIKLLIVHSLSFGPLLPLQLLNTKGEKKKKQREKQKQLT